MKTSGERVLLLSIKQVAEILGISHWTIRSWRDKIMRGLDVPPAAKELCCAMLLIGNNIRIPEDFIDYWLTHTAKDLRMHPDSPPSHCKKRKRFRRNNKTQDYISRLEKKKTEEPPQVAADKD